MHHHRLLVSVLLIFSFSVFISSHKTQSWEKKDQVPDEQMIHLMVALKQRNIQKLKATCDAVSYPNSPRYGEYLTLQEIASMVAPDSAIIAKLEAIFMQNGAKKVVTTLSRDFMDVHIPAGAIKAVFGVTMHHFQHKASGRMIRRTDMKVKLPEWLAPHIDLITGLGEFFDYPTERRNLRSLLNKKAKAALRQQTNAPEIEGRINGGEGDISPGIIVYCQDGSKTQTPKNPCSDFPPAVQGFELQLSPDGYDSIKLTLPASNCVLNSGNETVCSVHANVPKYRRLQISVRTFYSNGQYSDVFKYPTKFSPSPFVTPQKIYELYGVPQNTRGTHPKNSQSVVAFEKQYISLDDLKSFFKEMGLPYQDPVIHGENDPTSPGGESTLDIQYIMGVGVGINTTFWSVSGDVGHGGYILEWAKEISDTVDAPLVTSISYGDTEDGYFNKFGGWDYIYRMDKELIKMCTRGLTVLAGSGDAGASNVGESGNDLSPTDPTCTPMRAFYPSNSAYVTSVSSTFLTTNALPICEEKLNFDLIQCSQVGEAAVGVSAGLFWTTGGGFSNLTMLQPWQADFVEKFKQLSGNDLPPSQFWNSSGRGYPDISTIGHNLLMVLGGKITPVDGTSASGPVLAGLIGLLNDVRLNNGYPSMGWLNPFVYQLATSTPEAFRDVVSGNNFDGDIQRRGSPYPIFCPYGFATQPGWDAVTGLGTPNYQVLKEAALLSQGKRLNRHRLSLN